MDPKRQSRPKIYGCEQKIERNQKEDIWTLDANVRNIISGDYELKLSLLMAKLGIKIAVGRILLWRYFSMSDTKA